MDLESPRVSFSRDFVEAGGFETERCAYGYSPDFDFNNRLQRIGNGDGNGIIRSADQIFQNGKFVPFREPVWQPSMKQHLEMETEGKASRQVRPPPLVTCSSRWKEILLSPRRPKPEKESLFRRSCSTREARRSSSCAEPLLGRSISDSRLSCCFAGDAVIVAQPKCKSHSIQHRSHNSRISAADSPNLRRNRSPKEELASASRKRTSGLEKGGSRVQAADLKQRSRSGRYIIPDVANLEVAPVLNMPVCMGESFVVSTVSKLKLFDMQILPFSSRKAKASKPTKPTAAAA